MTEAVQPALRAIAETVDLIGLAILMIGAVKFLVLYAGVELQRLAGRECVVEVQRARQVLGGYILVSLEFLIVSDVMTSVVSRSLESLASLGAIVVIRTAMGFFLERELRGEGQAAHDS